MPGEEDLRSNQPDRWARKGDMNEVRVMGAELNGLGWALKQIVDQTIQDPTVWESVRKIEGSLVVREKAADVAVTIWFENGDLGIQNDAIQKPSAYIEAGFEELADISSGQIHPVRAVITRRIRAGGNLIKLLRMSKVMISQ
jgi:putative sterol carrier protein